MGKTTFEPHDKATEAADAAIDAALESLRANGLEPVDVVCVVLSRQGGGIGGYNEDDDSTLTRIAGVLHVTLHYLRQALGLPPGPEVP